MREEHERLNEIQMASGGGYDGREFTPHFIDGVWSIEHKLQDQD